MRVLVVTQARDRVGGVEAYLEAVLPALAARHAVAFCSAASAISERGPIALPPGVAAMTTDSLEALAAWRPDVTLANGLEDPALEAAVYRLAPVVAVQHTYHGTCISSSKTMAWPSAQACSRPFGPACLAQYFPRRCGGLNPLTMVRLYETQRLRLETLKQAAAVIAFSSHMGGELVQNGISRERVCVVPPFVAVPARRRGLDDARQVDGERGGSQRRLLYIGRLEPLKGVDRLLHALTYVASALDSAVHLDIAGDGAARPALERLARAIAGADPRITIAFEGWQGAAGRSRLLSRTDAIVVPSIWPEPFGLVGLEAAAAGVPAVAFATGGITDWLQDDHNGCLADAAGSHPESLARAIVRCVGEPAVRERLSAGAARAAARWSLDAHIARLTEILSSVAPAVAVGQAS